MQTPLQDGSVYGEQVKISSKFADYLIENDLAQGDDIDFLYGEHTISPLINAEGNVNAQLIKEQFSGRVPDSIWQKFSIELLDCEIAILEERNQKASLNNKFRTDNDTILADRVAMEGNDRSIIVHGVGHGAISYNDLDEQLGQRGLSSIRAGVAYDRTDITYISQMSDPPELNYFPATDTLEFTDFNSDGLIQGGQGAENVARISLASKKF